MRDDCGIAPTPRPDANLDALQVWNWKNNGWETETDVTTDAAQKTLTAHVTQVFTTMVGEPVTGGEPGNTEEARTRR